MEPYQNTRRIPAYAAALFLLVLLTAALYSCAADENGVNGDVTTDTVIDDGTLYTLTYAVSNPDAGRIVGEVSQSLTISDAAGDVRAVEKDGYVFVRWSDGRTDFRRSGDRITEDTTITAIFDFDKRECPVLSIYTEGEAEIVSREDYVGCTVSVSNTDKVLEFENRAAEIRGRGNATWSLETMLKKSYRLKFERKLNLLAVGSGSARDWVLLANHCDQSLLRNWAAFRLGRLLDGIEFSPSAMLVDVYLNGKYAGNYLLCEQVETSDARVDIDDESDKTDKGYLIELDMYADGVEGLDKFYVGDRPYSIKSRVTDSEQCEFIRSYVESVEKAIYGGDKSEIASLVDIDSLIDTYILEEFSKNIDAGWSSFFMYKKTGGKLYFGPPWDFDLAFGNDYRLDNGSYDGIYVGADRGFDQANRWYVRLCGYDWYNELVKNRWNEVKPLITQVINETADEGTAHRLSIARNFTKWKIFGQRINQEPEQIMALRKYTDHLTYLTGWMTSRFDWLDAYYNTAA